MFSLTTSYSQEEVSDDHTITLSSYVDGYYAGYNTDANGNTFRPYTTVGARGNSIGVNVAQMGINYRKFWPGPAPPLARPPIFGASG